MLSFFTLKSREIANALMPMFSSYLIIFPVWAESVYFKVTWTKVSVNILSNLNPISSIRGIWIFNSSPCIWTYIEAWCSFNMVLKFFDVEHSISMFGHESCWCVPWHNFIYDFTEDTIFGWRSCHWNFKRLFTEFKFTSSRTKETPISTWVTVRVCAVVGAFGGVLIECCTGPVNTCFTTFGHGKVAFLASSWTECCQSLYVLIIQLYCKCGAH